MTLISLEGMKYRPLSPVIEEICAKAGLPQIAGGSGKGWSFWSAFQRCPRMFELKYVNPPKLDEGEIGDKPARDVGSAFHAFQVFHYIDYGLEPEWLYERLMESHVNKSSVEEGWRVFGAYRFRYAHDYLIPLAAEYPVRDQRSGRTCRYDLVAKVQNDCEVRKGIYIIEHKTASRFDEATLDGWDLDGEVLGQIVLWKKAGLDKEFGELQGVIVNIAGKQQKPMFHRVIVSPNSFPVAAYWRDLNETEKAWKACQKSGYYPRYLASCIGRYGKCDFYDHCRMGEENNADL